MLGWPAQRLVKHQVRARPVHRHLPQAERAPVALHDREVVLLPSASRGKLDSEELCRGGQPGRDRNVMVGYAQRQPFASKQRRPVGRDAFATTAAADVHRNLPITEFVCSHQLSVVAAGRTGDWRDAPVTSVGVHTYAARSAHSLVLVAFVAIDARVLQSVVPGEKQKMR